MANMRLILVVSIVIAIIAYIAVITMDRDLRMDAFADLGEKTNTFTMYYMNGCPHCESILPDFKKLVAAGQVTLNGKKTQFRMLEQADPAAAPELEARNVKGFPTFYLATADKNFIEYQGDRSASAIKEFIGQNAV
jgi:hypothetical protein